MAIIKKQFIKDGVIRTFELVGNKVRTTIVIGDKRINNPTIEQFMSVGWKEYVKPEPKPQPEPTPYIPTLEELVERKLRERYSINQEFEVQRKRETDAEAFQTYYDYVEECIAWAKEQDYQGKEED